MSKFKDYLLRLYKEKNISTDLIIKKQRTTFAQKLAFMGKTFNVHHDFCDFLASI